MNQLIKKDINVVPGNPEGGASIVEQGATLQQVRTQFCTAVKVQLPRPTLQEICSKCENEAFMSGDEFYYAWAAKNSDGTTGRIEGPSVKMANAAVRLYGNCATDLAPVQETATSYIFTAYFVDLETGFTMARQFRQSKKWKVHGKFDDERKEDMRFQIGQSKALRNVILNALPAVLFKKMLAKAKEGVRKDIEESINKYGRDKVIEKMLAHFKTLGVSKENIENVMNKKIEALDLEDIVRLRGDIEAIHSGQELPETLFPESENKPKDTKPAVTIKTTKRPKDELFAQFLAEEEIKNFDTLTENAKADIRIQFEDWKKDKK